VQVEEFLENSADAVPGKTALICGGHQLTYAHVESLANRLAHDLIAAGIRRGDRIAVFAENSIETIVSVFAILKAGGVFLVINPSTKADKLTYILKNCSARGVVCDNARYTRFQECRSELSEVAVWAAGPVAAGDRSLDAALAEGNDDSRPPRQCIDIDLAALIYTSGSTGQPKGVMLTHLNIISAATSITTYLDNDADDIIINVLPLAFDYGLYQVLMAFKIGGTIVLERSFTYSHAVLETIVREKVTGFPIVPTICAILLQMDLSKYDLSCLRYITNTAAALPTAHIRELRRVLPHVTIYSMYGLTECKRVSYLPPDQIDIRPGSVGRGMPNEELYIVDEDGDRVPPGITGELVVRGSNVMKGYWNDPVTTNQRLKPGPFPWEKVLYTGDLFRADDQGFLYFVGRKDDIIKSHGEKVSPREVEEALYKLHEVAEAVVVGVPDPVLGSAVKALVSLRPGSALTPQDVQRHCARNLETFMVPKYVEFVSSLPKSSNGKFERKDLARV
jgi:long-chain acyl-CoA synthetase